MNALQGSLDARKRDLRLAWIVSSNDHKAVNRYLNPDGLSQSSAEMLSVLQQIKAAGAAMTIKSVPKGV